MNNSQPAFNNPSNAGIIFMSKWVQMATRALGKYSKDCSALFVLGIWRRTQLSCLVKSEVGDGMAFI
jgi:hypothetical protein